MARNREQHIKDRYMKEIFEIFDTRSEEMMDLFEEMTGESLIKHVVNAMPAGEVLAPYEALLSLMEETHGKKP